jgi:hypothetical protein
MMSLVVEVTIELPESKIIEVQVLLIMSIKFSVIFAPLFILSIKLKDTDQVVVVSVKNKKDVQSNFSLPMQS